MKKCNPQISIIVPVYNVAQYLSRCVNSIISQLFQDFELILIDDGSSDGSEKICDDFASKDERIKVYHKTNGGVSSARNMGLDNATGEWIFFCDADDELFPEGLQILLSNVRENTLLSFGGHLIMRANGSFSTIGKKKSGEIKVNDMLKWLLTKKPYYQGYLWNKLFSRKIIEKYKLRFNVAIHFNEDRLFIVQYLCSHSGIIYFSDNYIYHYYECNGGAMSSLAKGFNIKFVTDLDAFCEIVKTIKYKGYNDVLTDSKRATFLSYCRIVSMLKKWKVNDLQLRKEIKEKVLGTISINEFILFTISIRFKNWCLEKIKKSIT